VRTESRLELMLFKLAALTPIAWPPVTQRVGGPVAVALSGYEIDPTPNRPRREVKYRPYCY